MSWAPLLSGIVLGIEWKELVTALTHKKSYFASLRTLTWYLQIFPKQVDRSRPQHLIGRIAPGVVKRWPREEGIWYGQPSNPWMWSLWLRNPRKWRTDCTPYVKNMSARGFCCPRGSPWIPKGERISSDDLPLNPRSDVLVWPNRFSFLNWFLLL